MPKKTDKTPPVAETKQVTVGAFDKKKIRKSGPVSTLLMKLKRPAWLRPIGLIILVVVAYLLFVGLHHNKTVNIGGTKITNKTIDSLTKELAAYQKANPGSSFGSDLKQYATDKLILHAALKLEAKKYNVSLTDNDMAKAGGLTFPDPQTEKYYFINLRQTPDNIQLINIENVAYQTKLQNNLLDKKELTVVDLMLDTPYFRNLPQSQVQAAYNKAKSRMDNNILPLIEKGATERQIGAKADIVAPADGPSQQGSTDSSDAAIGRELASYQSQGVVTVMQVNYQKGITDFNDNNSTTWIRGDIGKVYKTSDKVDQLKKVGDNTGLFASHAGNFTIIRLDSKTGGAYDSWADFLNHYKDQYVKGKLQIASTQLGSTVLGLANRLTQTIMAPGLGQAWADFSGDCNESDHKYTMTVVAWDTPTGAALSGGRIQFSRTAGRTYNYPPYKDKDGNDHPGGTVTACGETGTFSITSNASFVPNVDSSASLGVHGNTFVDNCANTPLEFSTNSVVVDPNPAVYQPINNSSGTNAQWEHQQFDGSSTGGLEDGFPDPPNQDGLDHIRPGLANLNTYNVVLEYKHKCTPCGQPGCPGCPPKPPASGTMTVTCSNVSGDVYLAKSASNRSNTLANRPYKIYQTTSNPFSPILRAAANTDGNGHYDTGIDGNAIYGNGSSPQTLYIDVTDGSGNPLFFGPHPSVQPPGYPATAFGDTGSYNCEPPPQLGVNGAVCNGSLSGWAAEDLGTNSETITVEIYDGDRNSGGNLVGSASNNGIPYNGGVPPGQNPNFAWQIPSNYFDGQPHTFYVYDINSKGDFNTTSYGTNPVTMAACWPYSYNPAPGVDDGGNDEDPATITFTDNTRLTFNPSAGAPGCVNGVTVNYKIYQQDSNGNLLRTIKPSTNDGPRCVANETDTYDTYTVPPGTFQAGDQFCIDLSITPGGGLVDAAGNQLGGPTVPSVQPPSSCITVVNKPFFKVYNSSVSSGSSFPPSGGGSCTGGEIAGWNNDTGTDPPSGDFGAGTQLNALAALGIVGFASGQNLPPTLNGAPARLTFANNGVTVNSSFDSPQLGGSFGNTGCLVPRTPKAGSTPLPSANINALPSGNHSYVQNGNLRLKGGTIPAGTNISIFVNGNVYISPGGAGGIKYGGDGSWSVGNVPSFFLVATGNIYIDPGVGELDGVYTAQPGASGNGTIYTCGVDNGGGNFTYMAKGNLYDSCKQQLTVYGAFTANQVDLMRTMGSLRDETPIAAGTVPQTKYVYPVRLAQYSCNVGDQSNPYGHSHWYETVDSSGNLAPGATGPPATCPGPSLDKYLDWMFPPGDPDFNSKFLNGNYWLLCEDTQQISGDRDHYIEIHAYNDTAGCLGNSHGGTLLGYIPVTNVAGTTAFYENYDGPGGGPCRSSCTGYHYYSPTDNAEWDGGIWGYLYTSKANGTMSYVVNVPVPAQQQNPPTCSNPSVHSSPRPTCAAEVFDFTPELYLANPTITQPNNGALQLQSVTSLPPVL